MDVCERCGNVADVANPDLCAMLCFDCSDAFNAWCDAHPLEPYATFILEWSA